MPDEQLDILIRSQADNTGFDQATQAQGKLTEGTKEGGKETELFNVHGKEMHKIFHALNEIAPGLGTAMKAIFNPATIGAASLLLAVQLLVKSFEEWKRKQEELANEEVSTWEARNQAALEAKISAENYAKAMDAVVTALDKLKVKENEEAAVLKAIAESRKQILAAQEATEKAAAGNNPIAQAEIERRYGRKRSDEELRGEQAEIDQRKRDWERERAIEIEARRKSDAAEAAKQKGAPGLDEFTAANIRKQRLEEETRKAELEANNMRRAAEIADIGDMRAPRALNEAMEHLAEAMRKESENNETINRYQANKDRLEADAKKAQEEALAAKKQREATEADISSRRSVQQVHQQTATILTDEQRRKTLIEAGFKPDSVLGKTLIQGIEAEEGVAHGEKMTQKQAETVQKIIASLRVQGATQDQINAILKEMMDLHIDTNTKIRDLMALLRQAKQQQALISSQMSSVKSTLPGAG